MPLSVRQKSTVVSLSLSLIPPLPLRLSLPHTPQLTDWEQSSGGWTFKLTSETHCCDTQFERAHSQSNIGTVTSSGGQKVYCLITTWVHCYSHICDVRNAWQTHLTALYSLSPFLSPLCLTLSLISLLSAADKRFALYSFFFLLHISKLEPYLYNVKSAKTSAPVPCKSCFKGMLLIHDAFVLPSVAPYGNWDVPSLWNYNSSSDLIDRHKIYFITCASVWGCSRTQWILWSS